MNDNYEIFIFTAIDSKYWKQKTTAIRAVYQVAGFSILSSSFFICLIFKFLTGLYKTKYNIVSREKNLQKEESLLKENWEFQYMEKEKIKLQYFFAKKANELAHQSIKQRDGSVTSLPYAIILEQEFLEEKILNLEKVTRPLLNIFASPKFNLNITNDNEITFESEELFAQVVYSTLSYLFFLSPEASIKLCVKEKNNNTTIQFTVDRIDVFTEKELEAHSQSFFKTHANVFILNIRQILHVFRERSFVCEFLKKDIGFVLSVSKKRSQANNIISINGRKK